MSTGPRMCARCLYDSDTPGIVFDGAGVCNYCAVHDDMDRQYPTGPPGDRVFPLLEWIRAGRWPAANGKNLPRPQERPCASFA